MFECRYDRKGNARAFGAEANATRIKNQAEDEEWQLAEHFKLHLHPTTMRNKHNIIVQPLPRGIGLDQIYADFFGYILRHTETFFQDREIHGTDIWARLKGSMEFVIAHPNGWAAHEQGFLRKAAVMAGFVPSSTSHERIHVVSEGEASVHFVMVHGDFETRLKVSHSRLLEYCHLTNICSLAPNSLYAMLEVQQSTQHCTL